MINSKTKIPWLVEMINIADKHKFSASSNPTLGDKVAIITEILQCMNFYLCSDEFQNQNFLASGNGKINTCNYKYNFSASILHLEKKLTADAISFLCS